MINIEIFANHLSQKLSHNQKALQMSSSIIQSYNESDAPNSCQIPHTSHAKLKKTLEKQARTGDLGG